MRFSKVWMRNELLFNLFAKDVKQKNDEHVKTLHDFTEGIIKQRRKKIMEEDAQTVSVEDGEYPSYPLSFLSRPFELSPRRAVFRSHNS